LNKIKAVVLGPESMKHINHAVEIGPERPQGWIEKGNALFYMPKMFGGSKEKALEAYRKAIRLMEEDPARISDNWMYLNLLMILGQSYEETDQLQMAKTTYEKVLQVEPGFTYMRDEVYPAFLEKWESME
jgi:tetratricopeptide (TPR) repeat protein